MIGSWAAARMASVSKTRPLRFALGAAGEAAASRGAGPSAGLAFSAVRRGAHRRRSSRTGQSWSLALSDWFFCEVKGPGDALRPEQVRKFDALAAMTGRPVRLLRLRWAPRRTAERASPARERAPREAAVTRAPASAKRQGRVFDTEAILAAAREPITEKRLAEATGYVEQYQAGTFRGLMKLYVRQGLMTRPTEDTVQTSRT